MTAVVDRRGGGNDLAAHNFVVEVQMFDGDLWVCRKLGRATLSQIALWRVSIVAW
jgi:hypothetical protein